MSSRATAPISTAPAPGASTSRRGAVLAIIAACQLMVVLDSTVVYVALPKIQADLGFTASGLSWVVTSYTLAFGGLLLLGGRAGDILGQRWVFVTGIAVFGLASLVGGLATAQWSLLAARTVQGVGAALAAPSALALSALVTMLLFPAAMFGMFFFLTQFLQQTHGYGALRTGFAFPPMTILILTSSALAVRLLPRVGVPRLAAAGGVVVTAGMVLLAQISRDSGYAEGVLGPVLLFGAGAGIATSASAPIDGMSRAFWAASALTATAVVLALVNRPPTPAA